MKSRFLQEALEIVAKIIDEKAKEKISFALEKAKRILESSLHKNGKVKLPPHVLRALACCSKSNSKKLVRKRIKKAQSEPVLKVPVKVVAPVIETILPDESKAKSAAKIAARELKRELEDQIIPAAPIAESNSQVTVYRGRKIEPEARVSLTVKGYNPLIDGNGNH